MRIMVEMSRCDFDLPKQKWKEVNDWRDQTRPLTAIASDRRHMTWPGKRKRGRSNRAPVSTSSPIPVPIPVSRKKRSPVVLPEDNIFSSCDSEREGEEGDNEEEEEEDENEEEVPHQQVEEEYVEYEEEEEEMEGRGEESDEEEKTRPKQQRRLQSTAAPTVFDIPPCPTAPNMDTKQVASGRPSCRISLSSHSQQSGLERYERTGHFGHSANFAENVAMSFQNALAAFRRAHEEHISPLLRAHAEHMSLLGQSLAVVRQQEEHVRQLLQLLQRRQ
mmetsp:Transcript_50524/g.130215  ORF Transcript_50524/g.130215 Transcript_50524/m.130215 type:complete len:276 (-) Transcript_50524:8-835(-)